MSLADLDRWDADAIHAVFSAATDDSASTRMTSDQLGQIIDAIPWEGHAYDAARAANSDIRRDLNLHADELDAVAEAAKAAETTIRSIKSGWHHLQQEAAAVGMTIDAASGTVTYVESSDPEEAAIQEENYRIICAEVERLLIRADQADETLASAIEGADGSKSAEEITQELNEQWVTVEDAEGVVHDALGGDQGAAGRVNEVLDTITAEQQSGQAPFTAEQGAVVSQLQAQQHGMSVEALQTAEGRLGGERDMIGNSWQLMSNPKVDYPKTELKPGAKTDFGLSMRGGFEQLPLSVQEPLRETRFVDGQLQTAQELSAIAGIVDNGDTRFQNGTDVDRGILGRATDLMKVSTFDQTFGAVGGPLDLSRQLVNPLSEQLFAAGNADHIVDHELVTGVQNGLLPSMQPGEFTQFATANHWGDDGDAISGVFDWTGSATGSEAQIAGETAQAYSTYLGENAPRLLDMPGHHTVGEINPKLVQGFAEGLSPYVANIAGEQNELSAVFGTPDTPAALGDDTMPVAKGIFSVLNTDPDAGQIFNGKAYEEILRDQNAYAHGIAHNAPDAVMNNATMQEADTMRALVDIGTNNALDAKGVNTDVRAAEAYASKAAAYDMAVKTLAVGADLTPGGPAAAFGVDAVGSALKADIIGPAPTATAQPQLYSNMTEYDAHRQVLNGLHGNGVTIDLPPEYFAPGDGRGVGHIATYEEYRQLAESRRPGSSADESAYNNTIRNALAGVVGTANIPTIGMEKDTYNNIIRNPRPWN
jgi:hypothetical protein